MDTTTRLVAAQTVLSSMDLGELARIRQSLRSLAEAAAVLQTAEDSLYPVSANLEQMKLLAIKILSDRFDDEVKTQIAAEFDELSRQCHKIAAAVTFDGQALYRDDRTFELYTDEQKSIVWTSQSLPRVKSGLLTQPEDVFQSLQQAIARVLAFRRDIQIIFAAIRNYSDTLYTQYDKLLVSEASPNTVTSDIPDVAATAALILLEEGFALSVHSNKIKIPAPALLS